jgi:hypothetical protein
MCRDLRHPWERVGYYRDPDGITSRRLRCVRCGTERTDHWDAKSGDRYPSNYRYATGYQITGTDGDRVDAFDVRLEVLRRADVYANESQMVAAMTRPVRKPRAS